MTLLSRPLFPEGWPRFSYDCKGARFSRTFLKMKLPRRGGLSARPIKRLLRQPSVSAEFLTKDERDALLYQKVTAVQGPNYRGARVPVPSGLNIQAWEIILKDYHEEDLLDFIKFGFPLGFLGGKPPSREPSNHPSATRHDQEVKLYLDKELRLKAMSGPYTQPPFTEWSHTSPAMTRPKKNSTERRIIFDLSHGGEDSVNGQIPSDWFAGEQRRVVLPNADDLADLIIRSGQGCHLYSIDVARAYRIFRIDPRDWPLTGVWRQGLYYLDKAIQFGSRTGALACSMATLAVTKWFYQACGQEAFVYIDDFVSAAPTYEEACNSSQNLLKILFTLGVDVSYAKFIHPTTKLVWIGVEFDTERMQIRIDPSKVEEVRQTLLNWITFDLPRSEADVESLLGQLFHVVKCAKHARPYLSRIQGFLSLVKLAGPLKLTPGARQDLRWLSHFVARFNGVRLLSPVKPMRGLIVDACPGGLGGMSGDNAYHLELPEWFKVLKLSINAIECANILFALRYFCEDLRGAQLVIATDNAVAAHTLCNFKAAAPILQSIAREVIMLLAAYDIDYRIIHVAGELLEDTADALSRFHLGGVYAAHVQKLRQAGFSVRKLPDECWLPPLGL